MTALALLEQVAAAGVQIRVVGADLVIQPKGTLPCELRAQLAANNQCGNLVPEALIIDSNLVEIPKPLNDDTEPHDGAEHQRNHERPAAENQFPHGSLSPLMI